MSDVTILSASDLDAAALVLRTRVAEIQRTLEDMREFMTEETATQIYKYECSLSALAMKLTVFASQVKAEMIPPPRLKT